MLEDVSKTGNSINAPGKLQNYVLNATTQWWWDGQHTTHRTFLTLKHKSKVGILNDYVSEEDLIDLQQEFLGKVRKILQPL